VITAEPRSLFETRAARAEGLADRSDAAREPLLFAAGLYRAQGRMAADLEAFQRTHALSGHLERDAPGVVHALRHVMDFVAKEGPIPLADEARSRGGEDGARCCDRLLVFWRGAGEADYLSRALLRPYVELLSRVEVAPDRSHRAGHCPFCGGGPWVASRRSESGSDGARRLLCCALCGGEWAFDRIRCPCCGERDPAKLPSFGSERYPEARIEACEACRRYVKSIDLTRDARPIPEVDDLASLGLDLWAAEEGFTRLEPGLAGL
jgi:formate dehydrogenase maturation protein FdhE